MDHSKFVPSLAELIKANKDMGIQCYWQNKSKSRQVPGRCGNNIAAADVQERNRLIVSIRTLIWTYFERGRLAPPTPDIVTKIQNALKQIARWFLCANWHRKYSTTVVQIWCDELNKFDDIDDFEDINESRGQPARSKSRKENTTPKNANTTEGINIRTELNIQHGDKIFCHGINKNGNNCSRLISVKNSQQAADIIETLSKIRDISQATKDNLSLLAQLLLCRRSHQDQAADKAKEWLRKLRQYLQQVHAAPKLKPERLSTREPVPVPKSSVPATPPPRRAKRADIESPDSDVSTSMVSSGRGSVLFETPPTTPPRRGSYSTSAENVDSPSRAPHKPAPPSSQNETVPAGHTRKTRSSTFAVPPLEAVSKFIPHSPKGRDALRTKIYEKIKRTIIPREKPAGYIYGFKREGDRHIKVGFTCNIGSRISSWNSRCQQEVKVVLAEYLPHAAKVESLVHAFLHKHRRREVLVGGRCNGGRGCPTVHEEWFDITVEILCECLSMCKRWIKTLPYDSVGVLKPIWAAHVDKLYPGGSCHWRDWLDVAKAAGSNPVSVLVSPKVEGRATTTITETEIKSEEDDVADRLRDLSKIYVETIKELKTENPRDTSLNNYPVDRSIHLDDPFTAPLVAEAVA